jgi:hypothetical protein
MSSDCCNRVDAGDVVQGMIDSVLHNGAPHNHSLLLVDTQAVDVEG